MLTRARPFDGETVTDLISAIVSREPDWNALPANVPLSVAQLVRRCLQKDPRKRLRDIGEARVVLRSTWRDHAGASATADDHRPNAVACLDDCGAGYRCRGHRARVGLHVRAAPIRQFERAHGWWREFGEPVPIGVDPGPAFLALQ